VPLRYFAAGGFAAFVADRFSGAPTTRGTLGFFVLMARGFFIFFATIDIAG
jgi:hypothetical protein